jgi:hypothetical protein
VARTVPDARSIALMARPNTWTAYSVLPSTAVAMPPTKPVPAMSVVPGGNFRAGGATVIAGPAFRTPAA